MGYSSASAGNDINNADTPRPAAPILAIQGALNFIRHTPSCDEAKCQQAINNKPQVITTCSQVLKWGQKGRA
jgi:hypothetical protein